ncbi:hypothetical protein NBRC116590_27110 [Pelagimonas sp. KU-00592-HH]|uniref:hypothetical protein n=1 Tax=Pelagimonas sp. KU-00592-HH TaxID=3127651 RepID=UPI00310A3F0A
MSTDSLDHRLLAAHVAGDGPALVTLYAEAAAQANTEEARGFYLTHAYVFALEQGDARAADLHKALRAMGRDE